MGVTPMSEGSKRGDVRIEYTPRTFIESKREEIEARKDATSTMVGTQRNMPKQAEQYLNGYQDALDFVSAELRQLEDREIMGVTPHTDGDSDE